MTVALYALSFDAPEQFRVLCQTLGACDPAFLRDTTRFLLNDSTDRATDARYAELCKLHGFRELREDNRGIAGARRRIAEHFDAGDAETMFFFQDDLLPNLPSSRTCARGFRTHVPELFARSLAIRAAEGLDFVKLSFSEVYGDNAEQWAWHNVPPELRARAFPARPSVVAGERPPPTRFDRIGFDGDLGYAVGDVFYCDWPHVVTQGASRVLFLEHPCAVPTEHEVMARAFELARGGHLRGAVLLLSPITHARIFDYGRERRKVR